MHFIIQNHGETLANMLLGKYFHVWSNIEESILDPILILSGSNFR